MKGRKPKSVALKLLLGNPGQRKLVATGNPFAVGRPEKPTGLDKFAGKEWDRLVTHLAPVLSEAFRGMLLVCCDAYSQMMNANITLQKKGLTYQTVSESGSIMIRQRPEIRMKENARTAYHRALSELGASPVAMTRVHRLPEKEPLEPVGVKRFFT